MWLDFKKHIIILLLVLPAFGAMGQDKSKVLFNLKQNWVQYDKDTESFMPAISQKRGKTISFLVDGKAFKGQNLFISNSTTAHLFYNNRLLIKLEAGPHHIDIDSLIRITTVQKPVLALYGKDVKRELVTLIVTKSFIANKFFAKEAHLTKKTFSSFFIVSSILLLVGLILIKVNSHDLFVQYTNVSRAFNFTTIDEMIYKGGFFVNPSVQLIAWMSFSAAFILYYVEEQLDVQLFDISWLEQASISAHFVQLIVIAVGFFMLYVFRYLLISLFSAIFDMSSVRNIHFATHIRLTFYLLLFLQVLITVAYFNVLPINTLAIILIVLGALFLLIVLTGIRLSFIVRHPFVQLFLYLCGTEIFLFVFAFKLVVG